jgi:hypothetical protein
VFILFDSERWKGRCWVAHCYVKAKGSLPDTIRVEIETVRLRIYALALQRP